MSSRLTDKEAKLLTASMANINGGAKAITKLIDFDKVYEPAGYQDAGISKTMFLRLMNKIVEDGLEGTPGRYNKSGTKAKKSSTADNEGMDSSPFAAAAPVKPTKKRNAADELSGDENTPTKRVRVAPKEPKGATADGEEVLSGNKGASGRKAAGAKVVKKRKEVVLSGSEEEAKIVKKRKEVVLSASEEEEVL